MTAGRDNADTTTLRRIRTAAWVPSLLVAAGLTAGLGFGTITARTGCKPNPPSLGGPATSPTAAVDVPVIPRRDGTLLINVPHSRVDRAAVRTQQDANDLWRILYGTPYPTGRPNP